MDQLPNGIRRLLSMLPSAECQCSRVHWNGCLIILNAVTNSYRTVISLHFVSKQMPTSISFPILRQRCNAEVIKEMFMIINAKRCAVFLSVNQISVQLHALKNRCMHRGISLEEIVYAHFFLPSFFGWVMWTPNFAMTFFEMAYLLFGLRFSHDCQFLLRTVSLHHTKQ